MARAAIIGLGLTLLFVAPAFAQDGAGRTPMPAIPKAQGEHCVRDNAFMRRYHMTMLYQQRDATVHEGVRGGDFSIAKCVTCHAVPGADGKPVSYSDPRHFCRSCHSYASVSIDCFECHASKPETPAKAASAGPPDESDLASLNAYLGEVAR